MNSADNLWLFALSPATLQLMTARWLALLAAHGRSGPISELAWATTAHDSALGSWYVGGVEFRRASREQVPKAFGSQISFNYRCTVELKKRFDKAWAAF